MSNAARDCPLTPANSRPPLRLAHAGQSVAFAFRTDAASGLALLADARSTRRFDYVPVDPRSAGASTKGGAGPGPVPVLDRVA